MSKTQTRRFQKILASQGRRQNWLADKLGYKGGKGEAAFSRIVRGVYPLPPQKAPVLAELLGVDVALIREIFGIREGAK